MSLNENSCRPEQLSPLTLAFLGDAVYELYVREALVCSANRPANDLHKLAVQKVKASAQAAAAEILMEHLTEEELTVYKRGRNAHSNHLPKGASQRDYHMATGFESLVGYLHLHGRTDRLKELFSIISE